MAAQKEGRKKPNFKPRNQPRSTRGEERRHALDTKVAKKHNNKKR